MEAIAVHGARARWDAVVVGSGPNGLAAAVTLAREGYAVLVIEAEAEVGGGARSEELTRPGFLHDVCSAVHPLAAASPFFRSLPLDRHGLEWIHPPAPLAHPLKDRPAAVLERSVPATAATLGADGPAYADLMGPLVERWEEIAPLVLGPLRPPRHPLAALRFARLALRSAAGLAGARFVEPAAPALLAGNAAHSTLRLDRPLTAGVAILLGLLGHVVGWPVPRGGAGRITGALASHLTALGGEIRTGWRVESLADLPPARAVLLDVTPRQLLAIAGRALPAPYRRRLAAWRYGPAAFKVDWALDGPVPWTDPACARAGTVHLGGTLEEIAAAEAAVWRGEHPERPFVLLAQPSRFDSSRAPPGRHVVWAYTHVPPGSGVDVADRVEATVERFAPGFRDRVLARSVLGPRDLERHDANLVGGSIGGGIQDIGQTLARPVARPDPWVVPAPGLYLCSSSTPPGGGVHGLCGWYAARTALARTFR